MVVVVRRWSQMVLVFGLTDVSSVVADDISAGDAINLLTTSGNITIDAQGNDTDIILKGTDGGVDTTFLTIDSSAAGKATFNNEIVSGSCDYFRCRISYRWFIGSD